jgi:hypothetical protein
VKTRKVRSKGRYMWLVLFFLGHFLSAGIAGAWEDITGNIGRGSIFTCIEGVNGQDIVYVGKSDGLYSTSDGGKTWNKEKIPGGKIGVTGIVASVRGIFVSSAEGLFVKEPSDMEWRHIPGENNLLGVVIADTGSEVITWTDDEILFMSENNWKTMGMGSRLGDIKEVIVSCGIFYAARDGYLFFSFDGGKSWERYFIASEISEDIDIDLEYIEENDVEISQPSIRDISGGRSSDIIVSTGNGIVRFDAVTGDTETIGTTGLPSSALSKILQVKGDILAATDNKVFLKSEEREGWTLLFSSATGGRIVDMKTHVDRRGTEKILLITEKNIYTEESSELKKHQIFAGVANAPLSAGEGPGILEVQRMAIEYAEVSPGKISSWRQAARWKAILPRLSVSYSEDYNDNIEIYKAVSTSYVVKGPRERDNDWGVSMTWDLSDMIWNSAQTSIDVRSKLMVQLRDDILEDVTRLYFERKKLINEVSAPDNRKNQKTQSKIMRIEELTAYIDAYTGGGFSRSLGTEKSAPKTVF